MASYLTSEDLAARWRRSRRTVNRMAQRGEIPAMRIGDGWRFSVAAVEAYETGHTSQPTGQAAPKTTEVQLRPPAVVDGFTLPDGYVPVFPELWGVDAPTKKTAPVRG